MGEFVQRVDVITARAGQRAGACECHVFVAGKDFQFINTGFSGAGLLDCESHEPGLNRFESFHIVTDIYRLPRRLFPAWAETPDKPSFNREILSLAEVISRLVSALGGR